jgi:hypothetical protein
MRLSEGSCDVPKKRIPGVIKQKTSAQNNGHQQKNKTPDLFPDGMRGFFRFLFGM